MVGTVPNGTDPIIANYSIDGQTPQTRSVPSSSQCALPLEPFFSMAGLKNGEHYINISVVQVGERPYMLNFFALDPTSKPHQEPKKSNAGKIAGGVVGGLILLALICGISFFVWRKRQRTNIYSQNRAIDARMQQWMGQQDMTNLDIQKQSVLFGSSEGSLRDSVPVMPVNVGQRQYANGFSMNAGSIRGSTPSWLTRDTPSSRMRFSENPILTAFNMPPNNAGANVPALTSHFSPNTSMAFSPPGGRWEDIPVNDVRAREMSQITEGQVTAAPTTPKSLNALVSHFSPNTSIALSPPASKWDEVFASVKEAAAAAAGTGGGQVPPGRARGRTPLIIVEDETKRVSSGPTIHSAVSGSEDGQGRAV